MREGEPRSVFGTVGSGVIGVGLGLAILGIGFGVSEVALPARVAAASNASPTPSQVRAAVSVSPIATVAPSPTRTAAPSPTPTPVPTADPMVVTAYQAQGLRLAAIKIPSGYTFSSPIAGKVSIALYQYIDGEVRQGVTDQPSYPYIFLRSADREIKLRPGLIDKDIQMLVKDGDTVSAGAPLFRTLTTGASSWATFYDSSVTAQVVASAIALPANVEVDPVPIFKR